MKVNLPKASAQRRAESADPPHPCLRWNGDHLLEKDLAVTKTECRHRSSYNIVQASDLLLLLFCGLLSLVC